VITTARSGVFQQLSAMQNNSVAATNLASEFACERSAQGCRARVAADGVA
jgi:hypothetical protein